MSENDPKDAPVTDPTQASATDEASAESGGGGAPEPKTEDVLAAVTAERDKLRDQLLRTAADFDNFRKRSRKDIEEADRRGKEEVLREMLSIVDNLERAVQASAGATDVAAVADGVRLVLKSFDDIAQRVGLERVASAGQKFDPAVHDAVSQVESHDHEPGTVVTEVLAGYRLGARLLRPAIVVVAKAPAN